MVKHKTTILWNYKAVLAREIKVSFSIKENEPQVKVAAYIRLQIVGMGQGTEADRPQMDKETKTVL